ncbi:MAG: sigma-70 family RNA polymerase sigma factor [Bacteroidales bacterium]|nr:sigma-70 family RNA polymerase sigma factor [Bacteroidales bacterium]
MKTDVLDPKAQAVNSNKELIDALRTGNQKAQFQIYKIYYKAMYNISLRIVNDPMEAEDIMQESFLSAFEEIGKYSGTVSFGAWLKSIVRNKSIDSLRRNSKMIYENIENVSERETDLPEDQNHNDDPDITMNRIMDIIMHLPAKAGIIFSLYFLEGYDCNEISEILSISSATSRSQLSRARLRFVSEYKRKY